MRDINNEVNPNGVVNVYWSAFENTGNIHDFLKYKQAGRGAEFANGTGTARVTGGGISNPLGETRGKQ
ncbi:MAG: hypothetical protein LBL34_00495 [Clostridiales bacterium]|jgi:hypothetical protein|nr:hypothetical protein [Clostridiales bacterium]